MTDNRIEIEPHNCIEYFNRTTALMVTMANDGKLNVMALDWKKITEHQGMPVIRVQVAYSRYTYTLLTEGINEFTINIPSEKIEHAVNVAGFHSGRDTDKFQEANLEIVSGIKTKVPTIKDSLLSYECQVIYDSESNMKSHHYFYGKILATYASKEIVK